MEQKYFCCGTYRLSVVFQRSWHSILPWIKLFHSIFSYPIPLRFILIMTFQLWLGLLALSSRYLFLLRLCIHFSMPHKCLMSCPSHLPSFHRNNNRPSINIILITGQCVNRSVKHYFIFVQQITDWCICVNITNRFIKTLLRCMIRFFDHRQACINNKMKLLSLLNFLAQLIHC
jgi:hypothetical protein